MATSLDILPAETQLNICRSLLPEDPNETDRSDLGNLRLTCKALRPTATELYFESYYMLLRKEGEIYVQPRSLQLLREKPQLAALVRNVWIAAAATEPDWLRGQAAFGHYTTPDEETSLELAYTATDMFPIMAAGEDVDIAECRELKDFSEEQYNVIREYYQTFIAPPAYNDTYGKLHSARTLEVLLCKRLRLLPNVRQVRIVPPPITQTPCYDERYDFWMRNGFAEWVDQFNDTSLGADLLPASFPWNAIIVRTGLGMLPPTCKHLELDIQLSLSMFVGNNADYLRRQSPGVRDQLKSLSLCIKSDPSATHGEASQASLRWAQLTNQFSNLTSLAISFDSSLLDAADISLYYTRTVRQDFFTGLTLPNVYDLAIPRCIWPLSAFTGIQDSFPGLRNVHISHMVLTLGLFISKTHRSALWRAVARLVGHEYGGRCSLTFDGGPIIEFQGHLRGEHMNWSKPEDPAIICTLKRSVMDVVSAISTQAITNNDLEERYDDLVKHILPNVLINRMNLFVSQRLDEARCQKIDTLGMSFQYYDVMRPVIWKG